VVFAICEQTDKQTYGVHVDRHTSPTYLGEVDKLKWGSFMGYSVVKKVKVGFLDSATYTVNHRTSRALQSCKWQLIGKSQ